MALLIGAGAHLALRKHVTLVVDGRQHAVDTSSSNVQGLLAGEGISLTSAVLVEPPPATRLSDGMTVVVSPAAPADGVFDAVIPGSTGVGVWVVDAASRGLVGDPGSTASVGTSPVVSVRAVVSGKVHDVLTNADTAGALLSAMGITLDADDRVQPPPSTPLHDDMVLTADHVVVRTEVVPTTIAFRTVTRFSPLMTPGTSRVVTKGVAGVGRATYRVTSVDGKAGRRELIARWVEVSPVTRLVVSGPQSMYGGTTHVPGALGDTQTGLASWYDPPWSGLTAAHPSLPFGTRVTVTDLDTGSSVTVVIDDRGPFAPGKIIDLSPEAFSQLEPLGHGVLHVRLSW